MGRLADWPDRLTDHIEKWRFKKFRWGISDCSMFCLYAEKAMCGESRFQDFVGKYRSEDGATRVLQEYGQETLRKTIDLRLETISANHAMRGDIALIDTNQGDGLGLVIGQQIAAMSQEGLIFFPLSHGKKFWRI